MKCCLSEESRYEVLQERGEAKEDVDGRGVVG